MLERGLGASWNERVPQTPVTQIDGSGDILQSGTVLKPMLVGFLTSALAVRIFGASFFHFILYVILPEVATDVGL